MQSVTRYPTTAIAAVFGIVALVVGASLWIGADNAGDARLGQVITFAGVALQALLAVYRGESATHAARRADVGVERAAIATEQLATRGVSAVTAAVTAAAADGAKGGNGELGAKVAAAVERALIEADRIADERTKVRLNETWPRNSGGAS